MSEIIAIPSITGIISDVGSVTGNLSATGGVSGSISRELDHDTYTGEYDVIPRTDEQTLNTADRIMTRDVVIQEIPYAETINPAGGTTVNIAYVI